ncbi:unnamed protein product [Spirodela intermedia]|uniref:galactinol--sucrose galactosyltransferase n=1 Tax=Spirodela intermedia TaxID=51605 RepID=A0A7I8KFN5_SPIIN|nr:unnamed protein product [Spirodela intermedia]
MTIGAGVSISEGRLLVRGRTVLTGVPPGVALTPVGGGRAAAFVGAASSPGESKARHVFTLGRLLGFRLLCLFRFKIWWMIPRVGRSSSDIPPETQMLLLEVSEDSTLEDEAVDSSSDDTFYILVLPVLDGDFRASLQGNSDNELQFCVESGDPGVQISRVSQAVFINFGDNPYELLTDSIKILAEYQGNFSHVENKKIPPHLDWFGWCTWDAFYNKVNPQGIIKGLQSLSEGGCTPSFLIIDDGWQETVNEFQKEGEAHVEGTQFATRLVSIKENEKFRDISIDHNSASLRGFIREIKQRFDLKYVYMWHALAGYWGGVLPTSEAMKKYNPKLVYPVQSPGSISNLRDIAMDSLEKYGVGVIDPEKIADFYNDLHGYLAKNGVDGVKVDVQNLMETLGSGLGGRILITRAYQRALEESVARNFKNNNLICCMSLNSDSIYSSRKSAVARVSEDFSPGEPTLQTLHVASVSYNSLLLGEIVVPDWDMFQSKHYTAEFHGVARAVGGCGVYVSDKPGEHDFKILQKLVLPDGSILRARLAGRPTRDCLFIDPVMDGRSLLKIWNLNKFSGVIGVFNCQGAGSWQIMGNNQNPSVSKTTDISGHVSPADVEFLEEVGGDNWTGDCAILASKSVQFAPLGLIDMYNSGGAIEDLGGSDEPSSGCRINLRLFGCGRLGAYSSRKPSSCRVDFVEEDFSYDPEDGFLVLNLSAVLGERKMRVIEIIY